MSNEPDDEEETALWAEWLVDEHDGDGRDGDGGAFDAAGEEDDEEEQEQPEDADEGEDDDEGVGENRPGPGAGPHLPAPPACHTIRQGECVLSIAHHYKMTVDRIWKAGENTALRQVRRHPNQLLPGDVLFIPAREDAAVSVPTEQRHRFRLKALRDCKFVLRLLEGGEPRANLAYTLRVDSESRTGQTDQDGRLEERIAMDAISAVLVLHDPRGEQRFSVRLGHLDPIEEVTGVQARLNHLGFVCGRVDGHAGLRTRSALRMFQRSRDLPTTGEIDDATRSALEEAHRS